MKEDKFREVFDFQYTAGQWEQIKRVVDTQPGKHDENAIRETLELKARQFLVVPQIEANVRRRDNLVLARNVIKACGDLKSLLSETDVLREGSFYTAFKSRSEYDAIIDKIEELLDAAKLVAANNRPISQKRKRSDPRRDKYLGALCDLWAKQIRGKLTTSYQRGRGEPAGPFIDFLVSAAKPTLRQFTPHSAYRFIKRRRTGAPIVPFITEFSHWDNHWIVWLPHDPVYEAVEMMSAAIPEADGPLIWAFLTERDTPKRQDYYINSHEIAARTGWAYADIDYSTTGDAQGPLGLKARFADRRNKPWSIGVDFAPDARLSPAGLTDQSGHSAERIFLLFYRGQAAGTEQTVVTVDGVEMSEPLANEPAPPVRAAYGSNIYVAVIPFGKRRIWFRPRDWRDPAAGDLDFLEQPSADFGHHLYAAMRPGSEKIELLLDAQGGLERYQHRRGQHVLTVDFSPAVATSGKATYRMSFDEFHDLLSGEVSVTREDGTLVLDWSHQTPAWARDYPLQTRLQREMNESTLVVSVSK